MKVHICRRCDRLMNAEQFRYRFGRSVITSVICAMCRSTRAKPCKTQICPGCSLPSPRGNFLLFSRKHAPILKDTCTACRCAAFDDDTMYEVACDIPLNVMSKALQVELGLWEEPVPVPAPVRPTMFGRVNQWVTSLIKKR